MRYELGKVAVIAFVTIEDLLPISFESASIRNRFQFMISSIIGSKPIVLKLIHSFVVILIAFFENCSKKYQIRFPKMFLFLVRPNINIRF